MSTDPTSSDRRSGPGGGRPSGDRAPADRGGGARPDGSGEPPPAPGGDDAAAGGGRPRAPGRDAAAGDGPGPGSPDRTGPLDFDAYQERALETALFPDIGGERFIYPALGLADEAGEVLGKIKKLFRDRGGEVTPEFRRELKKELGDVYWYLAVLAHAFDLRSSEVAETNLRKLADRAERGVIRGEGDDR